MSYENVIKSYTVPYRFEGKTSVSTKLNSNSNKLSVHVTLFEFNFALIDSSPSNLYCTAYDLITFLFDVLVLFCWLRGYGENKNYSSKDLKINKYYFLIYNCFNVLLI